MSQAVKIKICGVRTPEVARAVADAGADFLGVVFVPASPRCVTVAQAAAIAAAVEGSVAVVGVFKDEPLAEIERAVAQIPLSRVQIHREMSGAELTVLSPIPMVLAISFDPTTFPIEIQRCESFLDSHRHLVALLIDTPDPTKLGGGTGNTFDWHSLRRALDAAHTRIPVILAGGLTTENVAEAIRIVRPWGVDVSSGVESARGVKDVEKIKRFCDAVRSVKV